MKTKHRMDVEKFTFDSFPCVAHFWVGHSTSGPLCRTCRPAAERCRRTLELSAGQFFAGLSNNDMSLNGRSSICEVQVE